MTKRARRFHPAPQPAHKEGVVHVLDNVTGADFERDEAGRIRLGIAGLSQPQRSLFLKVYLSVIDWEIGRAYRRARMQLPVEEITGAIDFEAVWELAGLTDSQRAAMEAVIVDGLSFQQAADLEKVSKSAIRDRVNLARLKIRLCFGDPRLDRGLASRAN